MKLSDGYVKFMRNFLNKEIIRVFPTSGEIPSYCYLEKVVFLRYIDSKMIKISTTLSDSDSQIFWLDSPYLDENWQPLSLVLETKNEEYTSLEGNFVIREDNFFTSYTKGRFFLKKATKTHLFFDGYDEYGYKIPFIISTERYEASGWKKVD